MLGVIICAGLLITLMVVAASERAESISELNQNGETCDTY